MGSGVPRLLLFGILSVAAQTGPGRDDLIRAVHFGDGIPETYLDAGRNALTPTTKLSICCRARPTFLALGNTALFSYHRGTKDMVLGVYCCMDTFFINPLPPDYSSRLGGFRLRVEDLQESLFYPLPLRRLTWFSYCVSFHVLHNETKVVFANSDQTIEKVVRFGNITLGGGGRLVLGEELDSEDDSFNLLQKFLGDMADLAIIYDVMSSSDVALYISNYSSSVVKKYNVAYDFEDNFHKFTPVGDVSNSTVSLARISATFREFSLLVPRPVYFKDGKNFCSKMKGFVYLPESEMESRFAIEDVQPFKEVCLGSHSATLWLGAIADLETKKWVSLRSRSELKYINFHPGWSKADPNSFCMSLGVPTYEDKWVASPCTATACVMCSYEKRPVIHIYGLCPDSLIETELTLDKIVNSKWSFTGVHKSRLSWKEKGKTLYWALENKLENVSLTTGDEPFSKVLLGRHKFTVMEDLCGVKQIQLLITICDEPREWTCSTGDCIPSEQRCDTTADCADFSDEMNCTSIRTSEIYESKKPPKMKEGKLPISFTLHASVISEVSLSSFTVEIDVNEILQWKDNRLRYRFPNENTTAELRKFEHIWTPKFSISDAMTSPAEVQTGLKTFYISRARDAPATVDGSIFRDPLYSGEDVLLTLMKKVSIRFHCQFALGFYPFDLQYCSFLYQLTGKNMEVQLNMDINQDKKSSTREVLYSGIRKLLEYEVVGLNYSFSQDNLKPLSIEFTVRLRNQYLFYLGNTFAPSVLLTLVSYYVFFFDIDDFQDRVMVSLTSLLVLVSLFTQTTSSIPKTSYMKLIDVWFTALIVFDFLVISVVVFIEHIRLKAKTLRSGARAPERKCFGCIFNRKSGKQEKPFNEMARKANRTFAAMFPVLYLVFIGVFFYYAVTNLKSM